MPGQVNDAGNLLDITVLEPYGVVAAIVPFNWPPIHTASKLAPALGPVEAPAEFCVDEDKVVDLGESDWSPPARQ